MAIGNLSAKVSPDEIQKARDKENPPEYDRDFAPESGGSDGLDNMFDNFEGFDLDGDSSSTSSGGFDSFGDFGGADAGAISGGGSLFGGLGDTSGGVGAFGQQQQQQVEQKPDLWDKTFDYSAESLSSIGKIIVDMVLSFKNRNLDDWLLFSYRMMIIGSAAGAAGLIFILTGTIGDINALKFTGISSQVLFCGGLCLSQGLLGLGGLSLVKLKAGNYGVTGGNVADLPDTFESVDSEEDDIGGNFNSETLEQLDFGLDDAINNLFGSEEEEMDIFNDLNNMTDEPKEEAKPINFEELSNRVPENVPMITRKFLFETFKDYYPINTPGFSTVTEIDKDSDTFLTLLALLNNAMASVAKVEPDEMECKLVRATETKFCYELEFKRHPKLKNTDEMERELENYFKSGKDDFDVTATVDTVGGSFIATITKGNSEVITLGDCFQLDKVQDFYLNEKNKMPFIMGVDMYGNPLLEDAKKFPTMMIVGIARSGKSWYVNGILMNLATFNPPDAVQFLVIDPKESALFKTIGLLPHTCGVHPQGNELNILKDVIDKEGARRKKLLDDNNCDDIWALRKKGIMLPYLYIVIDEVVTIINKQKELGNDKLFLNLLLTIITQLPSQGIGVLFVPHRATGIIDKTTRAMVPFAAAVRAKADMVKETLDCPKWTKVLTNPGDIALNTSDFASGPKYVRGTGITLSDDENLVLIANVAKAFYKMGVEIPDMSSIGCGYNRNEDAIREKLDLQFNKKVQYDLDNIDLDSEV